MRAGGLETTGSEKGVAQGSRVEATGSALEKGFHSRSHRIQKEKLVEVSGGVHARESQDWEGQERERDPGCEGVKGSTGKQNVGKSKAKSPRRRGLVLAKPTSMHRR